MRSTDYIQIRHSRDLMKVDFFAGYSLDNEHLGASKFRDSPRGRESISNADDLVRLHSKLIGDRIRSRLQIFLRHAVSASGTHT